MGPPPETGAEVFGYRGPSWRRDLFSIIRPRAVTAWRGAFVGRCVGCLAVPTNP